MLISSCPLINLSVNDTPSDWQTNIVTLSGRQSNALSECDEINCHQLLVYSSVLLGFVGLRFYAFMLSYVVI